MAKLTDRARELITAPNFAFLAELMPDGSPHVSPIWIDLEGELILVNTAKGRLKERNMRRDPRVSLALIDPDNPYRYLQLQGRVVEITEDGADQHIDKLAKKYMGVDKYPGRTPGEVRVIYKIEPERAQTLG